MISEIRHNKYPETGKYEVEGSSKKSGAKRNYFAANNWKPDEEALLAFSATILERRFE